MHILLPQQDKNQSWNPVELLAARNFPSWIDIWEFFFLYYFINKKLNFQGGIMKFTVIMPGVKAPEPAVN